MSKFKSIELQFTKSSLGIFYLAIYFSASFFELSFAADINLPTSQNDAVNSDKQPPLQIPKPRNFFDPKKPPVGNWRSEEREEKEESDDTKVDISEINEPIRGIRKYYAQTGLEIGFEDTSKCEPSVPNCAENVAESRHLLNFEGLIGWGPLVTDYLYFTPYYRYSHNWTTDFFQEERFFQKWFSTYKTEDFLVPTKQMVRNHEFTADIRALFGDKSSWLLQGGLFSKLVWSRLGSKSLGEPLEIAETIYKTENFIPYVIFKVPKQYRLSLYLPFKTELNKDDQRLSQKTYNLSSKGRGFSLSPQFTAEYLIPNLSWLAFTDLGITESKVASIQNDRRRYTFALGADIPLPWKFRFVNQISYFKDNYLVERIRNSNFTKNESADVNEPAVPKKRQDSAWKIDSTLFYQISKQHRMYTKFQYFSLSSSLKEFEQAKLELLLGYKYSLPDNANVQRKSGLFTERDNVEDI